MVTGTFALWHPGNLAAVREAARQASHVCVIIHPPSPERFHRRPAAPDYGGQDGGTSPASPDDQQDSAMPSAAVRLEMAAHLRSVSMVATCSLDNAEAALAQLRPFTLVDCLMPKTPGTIATVAIATEAIALAARKLADHIVDLAPVAGCFTDDIQKAIQNGRTPIKVPDAVMAPQPTRHDLDRFLETGAPGSPACNPSVDGRSIACPQSLRDSVAGVAGRPLVTVNGCFDVLHLGHVRLLAQARNFGARLLVLVNDDDSVRTYKGAGRPIFPIRFRLHALNALDAVAMAYPFSGDNPLPLLATIRPDIHVKGGSFEETRVGEERRLVESWGGHLEIIPLVEGFSTTGFISRMTSDKKREANVERSTSNA